MLRKLLIIAITLLLGACSDEMQRLKLDVKRIDNGLTDVRSLQAEQTTRINELESNIRGLQGRLEELDYSQKKTLSGTIGSLQSDLSSIKRRVPPPPIVPENALEEDEQAASQLPAELSTSVSAGLQQVREGNFEKAISYWQEAVDVSVGTQWAPMALFWTGVTYEGLGDNKKALQSYHDIVARSTKYQRMPLVFMRQASILVRLGDSKTAKVIYTKVAADYPKSEEAARAKERLKELK